MGKKKCQNQPKLIAHDKRTRNGKNLSIRNLVQNVTAGSSETAVKPALAQVFDNYVVLQEILQYLDHESMKALRAVNRRIRNNIHGCAYFQNRSTLSFFKENQRGREPLMASQVNTTDFAWKNIAVDLHTYLDQNEVKKLSTLLSGITSLELVSRTPRTLYSDESRPLMVTMVADILKACKQLKCLIISVDLLDLKVDYSVISENKNIQENLKVLQSLRIRSSVIPITEKYFTGQPTRIIGINSFASSVSFFGLLPQRLTKFDLSEITHPINSCLAEKRKKCPALTALISILKQNAQSLTSLKLGGFIFRSEVIHTMTFSSLKKLTLIDLESPHLLQAAHFVVIQPELETLELTLVGSDTIRRLFESVVLKHAETLRQLKLHWKRVNSTMTENGDTNKWIAEIQKFRAPHQKRLEEIAFSKERREPSDYNFDFLKILENLKIANIHHDASTVYLAWCGYPGPDGAMSGTTGTQRNPIFEVFPEGIEEIVVGGNMTEMMNNADPCNILEQLSRFQNLTVLNLVGCGPRAVDNRVLNFICVEMPQLLELGFAQCNLLTDEAIEGRKEDPRCPGLKNIRGLRKLHIVSCMYLTAKGILASVSFKELKELTLSVAASRQMVDFFVSLVKQNQSLQVLRLGDYKGKLMASKYEIFDACHAVSQRFRNLEIMAMYSVEDWRGRDENRFAGLPPPKTKPNAMYSGRVRGVMRVARRRDLD